MYEDLFERLVNRDILGKQLFTSCCGKTWEQTALALYQILEGNQLAESFRNSIRKIIAEKNQLLKNSGTKFINENLTAFARKELELAGLFDKDSDYEGMLGEAVLNLIETFAKQGHSGMSASLVRTIFDKLSNYKPLTELTDNPKEWNDISGCQGGEMGWQSCRSPSCFSNDGGKTYWDIDEEYFFHEDEDGTRWSGGLSKEEWDNRPIHKSKAFVK